MESTDRRHRSAAKALVWEDAAGQVWLGYNDPAFFGSTPRRGELLHGGELQKAGGIRAGQRLGRRLASDNVSYQFNTRPIRGN